MAGVTHAIRNNSKLDKNTTRLPQHPTPEKKPGIDLLPGGSTAAAILVVIVSPLETVVCEDHAKIKFSMLVTFERTFSPADSADSTKQLQNCKFPARTAFCFAMREQREYNEGIVFDPAIDLLWYASERKGARGRVASWAKQYHEKSSACCLTRLCALGAGAFISNQLDHPFQKTCNSQSRLYNFQVSDDPSQGQWRVKVIAEYFYNGEWGTDEIFVSATAWNETPAQILEIYSESQPITPGYGIVDLQHLELHEGGKYWTTRIQLCMYAEGSVPRVHCQFWPYAKVWQK